MFSDIDFMNMNAGFFDNAGMDSSYTGGIFDVYLNHGTISTDDYEDY